MNLTFRKMVPEDASAVEIVEKACFSMPWSRQAFWEEASNDKTYYLLALDDTKVIGYVGVWILFDEAQITNVAVLPEYRNQKIGYRMMEKIIQISLQSALHLYEKLGFKSVGRRRNYYEDGEDAEIMWITDLAKCTNTEVI